METRVSPLPSQTLVLNFLKLYIKTRESSNNTTTHLAVSGINYLYSCAVRTVPVDEALKKIVDDVKFIIKHAKEWKDWYNLIFILRVKAEKAQKQKTNKEEDSLLRETLHAMASLIVSELKNCSFEQGEKTLIDKRIQKLKDKVKIQKEEQKICLHTKKGNGCVEAFYREKLYLKELAELCDLDSAWKLEKYDLLKEYKCQANNSKAIPPYFHDDYHETVYFNRYQKITTISLTEFKESALKQEKDKIDKKIKLKNEELEQLKQLALSENEELKKHEKLKQIQSEIDSLRTELAKSENENKITIQKRLDSILQALNPILPGKPELPPLPTSEPSTIPIPPPSKDASTLNQIGVFAQKAKVDLNNTIIESYHPKEQPSPQGTVSPIPKSKM